MSKTIITKTCRVCKETKPLSEFYKRTDSPNGYRNNCKTCHIQYNTNYSQTEKGKKVHRKASHKHQQGPKGKVTHYEANKRYSIFYPDRISARAAVNNAIASGKLPKSNTLFCFYCPRIAQEYHHYKGYAPQNWLEVIPICVKCHNLIPQP